MISRLQYILRIMEPVSAIIIVIAATGGTPAHAASHSVRADGTGEFPTIQSAIDYAAAGDTVLVECGFYYGPGNRDIDYGGKAIFVTSATGEADCVTIDCQGSASEPHRGFIFHSEEDSTSVLRGIAVKGGFAVSNRGGGILCDAPDYQAGDGPSPTILNCVVRECVGGGIMCDAPVEEEGTGGASPRLMNCTIRACEGGGVRIRGYFAKPSFTDCRVVNNVGYGVSIWLASPSFRRCDFDSNSINGLDGYNPSGSLFVEDCQTVGNTGSGFSFSTDYSMVTIRRLTSAHNGGVGVGCNSTEHGPYDLEGCHIYANGDDGLRANGSYVLLKLANSDISENQGDAVEISSDLRFTIDNCRFVGNTGSGVHLVTDRKSSAVMSFPDFTTRINACEITANGLGGVQGVCSTWGGWGGDNRMTVEDCSISGNGGPGIELTLAHSDTLEILDSTVHENAGIGLDLEAPVIIVSRTLVTANDQIAIVIRNGSGAPIISCTDLWGNYGGDWAPPLDAYLGQDGNISADPMYCGPDLAILDRSPCLPGNHPAGADCGIIGARGMGCTSGPIITSIADVGNDEGRQVRLIWERSFYDAPRSQQPITGYGIYRRQDAWKSRMSSSEAAILPADDDHARRDDKLLDWDWLATVPARGDSTYQYVAATLCDSTIEAGICWSAYLISAMTADPLIFFDSAPDSGYSVDNTAPTVSADSDDIHGAFCILGAAPNPFNPMTTIKYDVPADGLVTLRIYDIRGALVRTLVDSNLARGSHLANWDGRDVSGRGMSSGSYFARLEAGGKVETVRMSLVR